MSLEVDMGLLVALVAVLTFGVFAIALILGKELSEIKAELRTMRVEILEAELSEIHDEIRILEADDPEAV